MMNSKLRTVSTLEFDESSDILGIIEPEDGEKE